jgi:hypothetical protein
MRFRQKPHKILALRPVILQKTRRTIPQISVRLLYFSLKVIYMALAEIFHFPTIVIRDESSGITNANVLMKIFTPNSAYLYSQLVYTEHSP